MKGLRPAALARLGLRPVSVPDASSSRSRFVFVGPLRVPGFRFGSASFAVRGRLALRARRAAPAEALRACACGAVAGTGTVRCRRGVVR